METANDDGTYDYKFYCQGKARKTHEEYTIAYEIDNVPLRLEPTSYMGEFNSTGNVEEGGWLNIDAEDIRYGRLGKEEELSDLDNVTISDLDIPEKFIESSYMKEKDDDDYTKVFFNYKEAGNIYAVAAIRDNKTGQTYQIQYSLFQEWADKDKEIQNFRDTVKLIPFDESLFEK